MAKITEPAIFVVELALSGVVEGLQKSSNAFSSSSLEITNFSDLETTPHGTGLGMVLKGASSPATSEVI